jgi:hypothetical protein
MFHMVGKSEGEAVPVLNLAPRYEDVGGRGGTSPRSLHLGTKWL